ncbi:endonuclease/exonuclease/phosphatase family protein [Pseudomonas luteola]
MIKSIAALLLVLLLSPLSFADVRIGTWNVMRLGSGDSKNYDSLAIVGSHFDFIALQEVMTEEGLSSLKEALEKETHEKWNVMASHLVGRGRYKEMYAFIWRESAVSYVDGAVLYTDTSDDFEREPFSAKFMDKSTGANFAAATIHIYYGKSESDRTPEIRNLTTYWKWLDEVYSGTPVLLMGDFNMNPDNDSWVSLKEYAMPLAITGASTLSLKDGLFSNLYDNIWVSKSIGQAYGSATVYEYPKILGVTNEEARKTVSDHAPLYLMLKNIQSQPLNKVFDTQKVSAKSQEAGLELIHGNKNSRIYHLPGCPSYNSMSEGSMIAFKTEFQAKKEGYRMAKNCRINREN